MGEEGKKSRRIISINEDRKSRRNSLTLGVQEKMRSVLTMCLRNIPRDDFEVSSLKLRRGSGLEVELRVIS